MSPLLNQGGTFVTIIAPVFHYVDKYGLISGLSRTAYKAAKQTLYVRAKINKSTCEMIASFNIGIIQRFELSLGSLRSGRKCAEWNQKPCRAK